MDGNTISNERFISNDSLGNFNADGSPVISSGQGDIILAPGTSRSGDSKRWLAVVVIVFFLVAVVTGIAAMVVGNGNGGVSLEAKEAFIAYYDLMRNGQGDEYSGNDPDEWYFYRLQNSGMSEADLSDYVDSLAAVYNSFYLSAIKPSKHQQLLNAYSARFELWSEYVSLSALRQNVIKMYVDQGEDFTISYIQELTKGSPSGDEEAVDTYGFLKEYLMSELNLTKLYNDFGCAADYSLDMFCMAGHMDGNATYEKRVQAQQAAKDTLDEAMTNFVWGDFVTETNELRIIFGEGDE